MGVIFSLELFFEKKYFLSFFLSLSLPLSHFVALFYLSLLLYLLFGNDKRGKIKHAGVSFFFILFYFFSLWFLLLAQVFWQWKVTIDNSFCSYRAFAFAYRIEKYTGLKRKLILWKKGAFDSILNDSKHINYCSMPATESS